MRVVNSVGILMSINSNIKKIIYLEINYIGEVKVRELIHLISKMQRKQMGGYLHLLGIDVIGLCLKV